MKKTKNRNKKLRNDKNLKFKAKIDLGSGVIVEEEADKYSSIDKILYDEVEDLFYNIMDRKYPESDFPNATISELFILEDGNEYPVVKDSDKKKIKELEKSGKYMKFLVLPEALYSLTPECRLWMTMKQNRIIPEDEEFDYEKMHNLVRSLSN